MPSQAPVKCPVCEQRFLREEVIFVKYKNRYYHKSCFDNQEQESANREKLIKYIERLFHKKIDYKITNQLKNFHDVKKFSYIDMYNGLYYFFEIKNNPTAKANGGIGILPYVIDEARVYFQTQEAKHASLTDDIQPITDNRKVTISDPGNKPKYKLKHIINILEL